MNDISKNFTCNESIKEKEVRVIDSEGNQLGILQTKEALRMADESELDLVMISPNAKPPVCKIMDLGKYIYEQAKKEKEAKKKQKVTVIKEIRCGITIEENDIVDTNGVEIRCKTVDGRSILAVRIPARQFATPFYTAQHVAVECVVFHVCTYALHYQILHASSGS